MHDIEVLRPFLPHALARTALAGLGERYEGKVRDVYTPDPRTRVLVATDRQSAFDILWCTVPLKGQVLTQISRWWFDRVQDVMPTHVIAVPDPNVMVARALRMLRVEIVVRGYLTGSTGTSAWVNYAKGVRDFCGVRLPENMRKNDTFASPILTPTTKGEEDELISPQEIVARGFATQQEWDAIAEKALALFSRGQQIAAERGLILVDTKYEMGYDEQGVLTVGDEVHTPDSSRYWVASTYEERHARGEEPESLDKEFFRLWLREQGFEYGGRHPEISDNVRLMLAQKYIDLYERITGGMFVLPDNTKTEERIERNLREYFAP